MIYHPITISRPTLLGKRNDLTSRNSGKLTPDKSAKRAQAKSGHSHLVSLRDFAKLGIAGLRDEETVSWMREAWHVPSRCAANLRGRPRFARSDGGASRYRTDYLRVCRRLGRAPDPLIGT